MLPASAFSFTSKNAYQVAYAQNGLGSLGVTETASTDYTDFAVMEATSRDISLADNSNNYPFHATQSLFNFAEGVSSQYHLYKHLTTVGSTNVSQVFMFLDASAQELATLYNDQDASAYIQGLSAFYYALNPDVSSKSTTLTDKTSLAEAFYSNIFNGTTLGSDMKSANKVREQFARIFLKDDGKKLFILYQNKNKNNWGQGRNKPFAIREIDLLNPNTFQDTTNVIAQSDEKNDTLVYDISLQFNAFDGFSAISRASANTGLYSQINDSSVRDIAGFHISGDGTKIFFLARRGRRNDFDTESIDSECTYFGEVSSFELASAWNVSSDATHIKTIKFYGDNKEGTAAKDSGIMPIDIDFSFDGTKLNILGSVGKEEFLYTYALNTAFTLPDSDLTQANLVTRQKIKDNSLLSFSSVDKSDGILKNVAGVGAAKAMASKIKNACVKKGNSFVLNSRNLLDANTIINIMTNKQLIHVIEHEQPKKKSSANNFFVYDPNTTRVAIDGGEKIISNLVRGQDKITFNGIEFKFLKLITKESEESHALVFYSPGPPITGAALSVTITEAGAGQRLIMTQPLTDYVQGILREENIEL